jgi:hypothetical protein
MKQTNKQTNKGKKIKERNFQLIKTNAKIK